QHCPLHIPPHHFSPFAFCKMPRHPTLCIALGDGRLGCSCSVMETHSMKLSTHCCWAHLKATPSLGVFCLGVSADSWRLLRIVRFSMR
ncbi:unnamed protein product, partial [Staurois parvus]